jgi:hypothetical protein
LTSPFVVGVSDSAKLPPWVRDIGTPTSNAGAVVQ